MPLNWSIANVENYEELLGPEGREPDHWGEIAKTEDEIITECLVFATMVIGMDSITEKNVDEFILRFKMHEALGKRWWRKGGEQQIIPESAIRRRIGLYTNASTMTTAQWNKHFVSIARDTAHDNIRFEQRKQEEGKPQAE